MASTLFWRLLQKKCRLSTRVVLFKCEHSSIVCTKENQAPASHADFAKRLALHLCIALLLLVVSIGAGMLGHKHFEGLPALDGFFNAAMLLGGMGPVNVPVTAGGKLFAGLYALYAGLIFIVSAALILTPIIRRILHKFHWNDEI
jgi:hypothetical protein